MNTCQCRRAHQVDLDATGRFFNDDRNLVIRLHKVNKISFFDTVVVGMKPHILDKSSTRQLVAEESNRDDGLATIESFQSTKAFAAVMMNREVPNSDAFQTRSKINNDVLGPCVGRLHVTRIFDHDIFGNAQSEAQCLFDQMVKLFKQFELYNPCPYLSKFDEDNILSNVTKKNGKRSREE
jgi:hypothetical protein